jgi:hypothetical protein
VGQWDSLMRNMFSLFVTEKTRKKNTKDIWDDEEVIEGSEFDLVYDLRNVQ